MHADAHVVSPPPDEQVDLAVEVFRMLADSTRIRLLHQLSFGECSVNDLAAAIGRGQTGVSQHLAKLRLARLVQSRRQGNQVFYRIESDHVRQLVEDALHNAEHALGGVPAHHQRGEALVSLPAAETARLATARRPRTTPTLATGSPSGRDCRLNPATAMTTAPATAATGTTTVTTPVSMAMSTRPA